MFSVNNISIHFTGTYLFEDISFLINRRDRIGLVGRNGAGKTTLLKIIKGEMDPHNGTVVIPSGKKVGYLPQEIQILSTESVFQEALKAFAEAIKIEKDIQSHTEEIANLIDYSTLKYTKLVEKLIRANERYEMIGGHMKEAETEKVLIGLGFQPEQFKQPLNEFSGGWQMRVELAKILLTRPELLLLDEPTNHLDIESIQWLENFLSGYAGAIILVSHDRALLDNVTNRTIEVSLGEIYDYKENYSGYVLLREQQREKQLATFNNQQRQIAQVERFIERFRYKNTKANQVQSRVKMLKKLDRIEVDDVDKSAIHFTFPSAPRSGKVIFEAQKLSKWYGHNQVLKDLDFAIVRNDFVAFVGKNGEGKTTLARIIVGDIDHSGVAKPGYKLSIGYFAQNQAEMLDPDKTVFQTIDDVAVGDMRTKVRGVLGSFLFSGDSIDKKVKVLSGGEKSRLAIARLLLTPVNLLVLDEPTNHLDMHSKDILKNALLKYDGTLIIVSHDRDFLQGLTNKVFEFKKQGVRQYIGDIYDFMESRKLNSLKELEKSSQNEYRQVKNGFSQSKLQYEQRKQFEKDHRRLAKRIMKCESEIETIEDKIKSINSYLAEPEIYKDKLNTDDIFEKYAAYKLHLERAMETWGKLHDQLEELKKNNYINNP